MPHVPRRLFQRNATSLHRLRRRHLQRAFAEYKCRFSGFSASKQAIHAASGSASAGLARRITAAIALYMHQRHTTGHPWC